MTGQGTSDMLNDNDIALAGEYVLGLLDTGDYAAALARVDSEPAFAAEVTAWEARLNPLLNHRDEAPAPHVYDRITAALPGASPTLRPALPIASGPVAQNDNARSLRWWQGISGAAIAASAIMAVMLFNTNTSPPAVVAPAPSQILVAAMAAKTGPQAMTARYDVGAGELLMTPVGIDTKQYYPELWIINVDGKPQSLGMLAQDRSSKIIVAPELRARIIIGATLAVTAEPQGGAPGGNASDRLVVLGEIKTI